MTRRSRVEIIVTVLVFIFLYTGLTKLFDPSLFSFSLSQAPIVKHFANLVVYTLPPIELLVVVFLTLPRTRLWGLYAAAALLTVFTIYLTGMVLFAPKLPCGCGGIISKLTWRQHILVNLILLALAICGIILQRRSIHDRVVVAAHLPA